MNVTILEFLEEMKELTGESFVYQVHCWSHSHREGLRYKYCVGGLLSGFAMVEKETEDELIKALPLIRDKVKLLIQAEEVSKKINAKLLN